MSALHVTLISSKLRVYLLKDTTYSISDQTLLRHHND